MQKNTEKRKKHSTHCHVRACQQSFYREKGKKYGKFRKDRKTYTARLRRQGILALLQSFKEKDKTTQKTKRYI